MNIGFLLPSAALALAALLIPILIHLIRRPEQRRHAFAALRWLSARAAPKQRLRWHERALLALRLLLLALMAALLARPVWWLNHHDAPAWGVVAPGVDGQVLAGLRNDGSRQWHWLSPGFPALDVAMPGTGVATFSLLRELDLQLPVESGLVVVVPETLGGLDAERPVLHRAVDWRIVAAAPSPETVPTKAGIAVALRYPVDRSGDAAYLRAATRAWNESHPGSLVLDSGELDKPLSNDTRVLVWLDSAPPETVGRWLEQGGRLIREAAAGEPGELAPAEALPASRESVGRGQLLILAHRLSPSTSPALLSAEFPARWQALLTGPVPAPVRAEARAVTPLKADARETRRLMGEPLSAWLAILILAVLAVERWWALRTREAWSS